jgi:hypothetical protein
MEEPELPLCAQSGSNFVGMLDVGSTQPLDRMVGDEPRDIRAVVKCIFDRQVADREVAEIG